MIQKKNLAVVRGRHRGAMWEARKNHVMDDWSMMSHCLMVVEVGRLGWQAIDVKSAMVTLVELAKSIDRRVRARMCESIYWSS